MQKIYFKLLSIMLFLSILFNNCILSFAYELDSFNNSIESVEYQNTKDENFTNQSEVYAELASVYKVTIPKTIVLSGVSKKALYTVKVEGDIAGYETIYVIPEEFFKLFAKNKSEETANIKQDITSWTYSTLNTAANGIITAENITAGKWTGTFNFNIELNKVAGDAVLPGHEHLYKYFKTIKQASCIEEGIDVYVCSECKNTKEVTTQIKPHTKGSFETTKNATCTEDGLEEQKCTVCGEILDTKTVPALGHDYIEGVCTRCGDTLPDLIVIASGFTGTYDNKAHSISVSSPGNTILYSTDNVNFTEINPSFTDAGTYTVYYKVSKNFYKTITGSKIVQINKANSTVQSAPTGKTLSYNTNSQTLINAGTATNGTMQYSLDNNEFSTALPSATNAGTYIIYYKVVGNKNYSDTEVKSVKTTISKIDNAFALGTKQGGVRKGDKITTTVSANKSGGQIEIKSSNANIATGSVSGNTITINGVGIGSCDLTIIVKETTNYKSSSITYPVVVSNAILNINPNGGTYNSSSDVATFGVDEGKSYTKSFSYTGNVQEFTVPYTGFYFIEAWGGKGGIDSTIGLDGGGGATTITTTNRGVLANYANYKNEVLMVAGGGSGGSLYSVGEGGTVLYAYTESNKTFPGAVINGASTAKLSNTFAQGQHTGTSTDGGGGGGGWYGGKHGLDAEGNAAGGGASFINTNAGCIPIELIPSNNKGAGRVTITYEQRSINISDPVRNGYKFDGWKIDGSGTCTANTLGKTTMFKFVTGTTATLTAKWTK